MGAGQGRKGTMERLNKDVGAGALFVAFGGLLGTYAAVSLHFGTPFRMGPGFFPVVVGGLLALFGALVLVRGLAAGGVAIGPVPWRAVVVIPAALIGFGLAARPLGLVPALFLAGLATAF